MTDRNSGDQPEASHHYSSSELPPDVEHVDLPPLEKTRVRVIAKPELTETVMEVPHVQYIERIKEVETNQKIFKPVAQPKFEVTERIIEIPKQVKEKKIVEVPHTHVVDRVEEIPHYIEQRKLIERPKITLQERIIPIPKRTIEEKTVEVSREALDEILHEYVNYNSQAYDPAQPSTIPQKEPVHDEDGKVFSPDGKPLSEVEARFFHKRSPLPAVHESRAVDEVYEIPHIQHVYRNIMQPVYRHIPKPIEVPLTHYEPVPVERIVDRNVPIPVELEVVQEFFCPRLEPRYSEVAVPISVTRTIEKPVAEDAMFNSVILDAYMSQVPGAGSKGSSLCSGGFSSQMTKKKKMTPAEIAAAGIQYENGYAVVKAFLSRGASMPPGVNMNVDDGVYSALKTLN